MSRRRHAFPAAPATLYHDALRATEIATSAPWVIALRMSRMMAAGWPPDARQQADSVRMVTEKMEAIAEAWWGMGWTAWLHAMGVASSGRAATSLPYVWGPALRPFHRRVRANLRRLSR